MLTKTNLPSEKLYDLYIIDKMCRGKQQQVLKMIKIFIPQILKSLEEISLAHHKKDLLKIQREIHKLKPTLNYYGTIKIEKELLMLEKQVTANFESNDIEANIKELNKITTQVVDQMKIDFSLSND